MNESVIASICQTTADYRVEEGCQPTPDRVKRWAEQFDEGIRDDLLAELDYVLKKPIFQEKMLIGFFLNVQ